MDKKIEILIVEDDQNLGTILTEYLDVKGYSCKLCRNGQEGLEVFVKGNFSLCLLDVMMPVKDGFTLAREIRKIDKKIPIIFLTAKSMKEDAIEGLRIGADDYVTKPFSMEELLLRIKAIIRRMQPDNNEAKETKELHQIGKYKFDYVRQMLFIGNEEAKLTSKEADLLNLLCKTNGDVLERSYALNAIWGDDSYFNSRSMDVYITKLRKYLKQDDSIEIINVHGRGFRLLVSKE
jgi:DNA-binding response OmpR family regulator